MQHSENNPDFKGIPGRNEMEAMSFSDNPKDAMMGRTGLALMDFIQKEVEDNPKVCIGCILSTIGMALTGMTGELLKFIKNNDALCAHERKKANYSRFMQDPVPRPNEDSPAINIGGKPGRYI